MSRPSTMRGRIAMTLVVLALLSFIFVLTPKSKISLHVPGGYPYVKPQTPSFDLPTPDDPASTPPSAQLIVKVQLQGEDLNWLLKLLPSWRNQVITIDKSFANLHNGALRVDKGRIADAYLTWIIINYANLASTMLFVPPSLAQQRIDKEKWRIPNKHLITAIQSLRIPHVQKLGFVNLHCPEKNECEAVKPFRTPTDEFRTLEVNMGRAWEGLFNNSRVPEELSSPRGSAFVVTREQVLRKGVEEYQRYWTWLRSTKMDDDTAGLLMESLWHVVFGRGPVDCPEESKCKCEVFGKC